MKTLLAIFESHWRETWRQTGRRTVPQISLETPLPLPAAPYTFDNLNGSISSSPVSLRRSSCLSKPKRDPDFQNMQSRIDQLDREMAPSVQTNLRTSK